MAITLTSKAAFADKAIQGLLVYFYGTKLCEGFIVACMELISNNIWGISSSQHTTRPTSWPERDVIA